jgi:hypothetical protein
MVQTNKTNNTEETMTQLMEKANNKTGQSWGIFQDGNVFLAITPSVSKEFKTLKSAVRFFEKRNVKLVAVS